MSNLIPAEEALTILKELDVLTPHLRKNLEKFEEEAPNRDEIVKGYFGEEGINRIVDAIASEIASRVPRKQLTILDVGCGTGTFTRRIKKQLEDRSIKASFHGLDPTWHMLNELTKHDPEITCLVGVFEKITESITLNKQYRGIAAPFRFDVIISTLAIHHLESIEPALASTIKALADNGWIIFCDTGPYQDLSHDNTGHHGVDFNELEQLAKKYFSSVEVKMIEGVKAQFEDVKADMIMLIGNNRCFPT